MHAIVGAWRETATDRPDLLIQWASGLHASEEQEEDEGPERSVVVLQ